MINFKKGSAPICLIQKGDGITKNYIVWANNWNTKLKRTPPNKSWNWYIYKGKSVNSILIEKLRKLTDDHCSFCDKYAPEADSDSIEHLLPKMIFPLKSFTWTNLFLSCAGCQKRAKGWKKYESKIRSVLKPDIKSYSFEKYFIYDTRNGEIKVNKIGTSKRDQERADLTIKHFQLNEFNRPASRRGFHKRYYSSSNVTKLITGFNINELPYRFMFQ